MPNVETRSKSLSPMAAVSLFGFASGLPLLLTNSTLQAWMQDSHVDLGLIGLSALIGLPYNLKFIWSPILDRFTPPFMGRRRGWILIFQMALVLGLCAMAYSDPHTGLGTIAGLAVLVAFFSASQDIVIDAYRTELLPEKDLGLGSSLNINFYRGAMLVGGAFALWLSDRTSWRIVYLVMAAMMLPGMLTAWFAPEPPNIRAPRTLTEAVVRPFTEFFSRRGALEMLAFTILYKLGDMLAASLNTVFLMTLDFSKTEIGLATKGLGLASLLLGAFLGGLLMKRWTLKRALVVFGILQASCIIAPYFLALVGHNRPLMLATIGVENFCFGTGMVAYAAFLMRICDKRMTATQYALLSSLMALTRTVFSSPAGQLVKWMGWPGFFLLCMAISIPGLLMLMRYDRWQMPDEVVSPES